MRPLHIFYLLLMSPTALAAQEDYRYAVLMPLQGDAPAHVVAAAEHQGGLGRFLLENKSADLILAVQLGWTIHDCGTTNEEAVNCPRNEPALLGILPYVQHSIDPHKEKWLKAPLLSNQKIVEKLKAKGLPVSHVYDIYVGVVGVQFAGGDEWEYDLVNEGNWRWAELSPSYLPTQYGLCYLKCVGSHCSAAAYIYKCCVWGGDSWMTTLCDRPCGTPVNYRNPASDWILKATCAPIDSPAEGAVLRASH